MGAAAPAPSTGAGGDTRRRPSPAPGTDGLDPVIHAPKRLRIMAILSVAEQVEYAELRDRLALSAPDLSKQMKTLRDAGYVWVRKSGRGPGGATWFRMSRTGRTAYDAHVAALRGILDGPGPDPAGGAEPGA